MAIEICRKLTTVRFIHYLNLLTLFLSQQINPRTNAYCCFLPVGCMKSYLRFTLYNFLQTHIEKSSPFCLFKLCFNELLFVLEQSSLAIGVGRIFTKVNLFCKINFGRFVVVVFQGQPQDYASYYGLRSEVQKWVFENLVSLNKLLV